MRIRKMNKFLQLFGKNVTGITLAPFGIYVMDLNDKTTLNHEKIHWKQQIEMLIIPFYIWYEIEHLLRGYYKISFEQESYQNQNDENYLTNRKHYAWMKYL
jgi:hypothetical protein